MPFLLWLSTGLSTISLLVSLAALWFSQRNIRLPKRKLDAIETALGDIDYALESLRSTDKRLNARIGMREARAKLAEQTEEAERQLPLAVDQQPGETPEQWKRRMRVASLFFASFFSSPSLASCVAGFFFPSLATRAASLRA